MDSIKADVVQFEIAKLELTAGDILAIRIPESMFSDLIQDSDLMDSIRAILPAGVEVMAYPDIVEFSVIKKA